MIVVELKKRKKKRRERFSFFTFVHCNLGICNALYNEIWGFIKSATIKDNRKRTTGRRYSVNIYFPSRLTHFRSLLTSCYSALVLFIAVRLFYLTPRLCNPIDQILFCLHFTLFTSFLLTTYPTYYNILSINKHTGGDIFHGNQFTCTCIHSFILLFVHLCYPVCYQYPVLSISVSCPNNFYHWDQILFSI